MTTLGSPDLGRSLSVHRGTFGAGGWLWYVGGILVANGVLVLAKLASGSSGPQDSLGLAAVSLALGGALLVVPFRRWRQDVELFERGFVWTRSMSAPITVARADVRKALVTRHHSRAGSHTEVSVELADGRELSIVGLADAEQLANLLAAFAVAPEAAPAEAARFPGGWQPPTT